jgi:hypothetical protein
MAFASYRWRRSESIGSMKTEFSVGTTPVSALVRAWSFTKPVDGPACSQKNRKDAISISSSISKAEGPDSGPTLSLVLARDVSQGFEGKAAIMAGRKRIIWRRDHGIVIAIYYR